MSAAELRTLLLGASLGEGPVATFAKLAIETWGRAVPSGSSGPRKGPLTNAEKCRRRRLRKKGVDPDGDTVATPRDTRATPETTPSDTVESAAPSRALPLLSSSSSSLSSSGSLSSQEPLDHEVHGGSTGAREGERGAPSGTSAAPAESGTFRLENGSATPPATPNDTKRDTARHRPNTAKVSLIALDWQPSASVLGWCREAGIDPEPIRVEFVRFWRGEGVRRSARGWDAAFRKRVNTLAAKGAAPLLIDRERPRPESPNVVPFTPQTEVRAAMADFFAEKDATGGTNAR